MIEKGNQMKSVTPEPMNTEQLLSVDPATLTLEQIQQRVNIVNLRKLERESELVEHENQKFQEQKIERERKARVGKDSEEAMRRKMKNEQDGCAHKTGGSGLGGWFSGDGALYGSSTCVQGLPTGERYILCTRCQKEWHDPSTCFHGPLRPDVATKRRVLDGKFSLDDFYRQTNEYREVMKWPRKTFEPIQGEYPTASLFRIPALEAQKDKDDREFDAMLNERQRKAYP